MVERSGRGAVVRVRVTPKARKPGVLGVRNGTVAIAVGSAPERGKATAEALELLARWLDLKASSLSLASGASSRDKRVLVAGAEASDLRKRIAQRLG